jgi:hypothetical protein
MTLRSHIMSLGAGTVLTLSLVGLPLSTSSLAGALTPAPCSPSQLTLSLKMSAPSYASGVAVRSVLHITNNGATCALTFSASSPAFSITNSAGALEWNNCFSAGVAGACSMVAYLRSVGAHQSIAQAVSWDQTTGAMRQRVAIGTYRVSATLSAIMKTATTTFVLKK